RQSHKRQKDILLALTGDHQNIPENSLDQQSHGVAASEHGKVLCSLLFLFIVGDIQITRILVVGE
ncbi:hypothetical protein MOV55_10610, partial [Enterobacter cloacae]|uniref:hypothetical protein n=1 Tax=Enterobacter cloacae TaxID=550 RepID=UPI001F536A74